jgi:hypothetical protein
MLEDTIYSAQSIGASLANAVINSSSSSSSSSTTTNIVESIKSFGTIYIPLDYGHRLVLVHWVYYRLLYRTFPQLKSGSTIIILPTLAFATGLASVFTALGVSASAIGGVFGGAANSEADSTGELLSAFASLISVLMGLQLLELIRVPLPSLDFGLRQSALAFDGGRCTTSRGGSGSVYSMRMVV